MAFVLQSQAGSLNPGADLWVLPDLTLSKAAQKLDWYLNFRLGKTLLHSRPKPGEQILRILAASDLPLLGPQQVNEACVLVRSDQCFPNRWTLYLQGAQDLSTWSKSLLKVWKDLGKPSVRVFLPSGISIQDLQANWDGSMDHDFFVVMEPA